MKVVKNTLIVLATLIAIVLLVLGSVWFYDVYKFSKNHKVSVFTGIRFVSSLNSLSKEHSLEYVTVTKGNSWYGSKSPIYFYEDSPLVSSRELKEGSKVRFYHVILNEFKGYMAYIELPDGTFGFVMIYNIQEFFPATKLLSAK